MTEERKKVNEQVCDTVINFMRSQAEDDKKLISNTLVTKTDGVITTSINNKAIFVMTPAKDGKYICLARYFNGTAAKRIEAIQKVLAWPAVPTYSKDGLVYMQNPNGDKVVNRSLFYSKEELLALAVDE